MRLRDYQLAAVDGLRGSHRAGHRATVLQAATGAGKTVIAAEMIRAAADKATPVLFFAHRRELIYQTGDKLDRFGVRHATLMAGERFDLTAAVVLASIDTFRARVMRSGRVDWPKAGLVIVDECHRSLNPTYQRVIEHYLGEGAFVVGLTATPLRADGRGLGHVYSDMVCCPSIVELTKAGHLVPMRYFAAKAPDLDAVRIQAGDYHRKDLATAMDRTVLVGDVVANWLRLAAERKTLVFAVGVAHSQHLARTFEELGVVAAHLDAHTPAAVRSELFTAFAEGDLQVLCNVGVAAEGTDLPIASCVVLACPTRHPGKYLQMAGRVLRPYPDKTDAMLLDHAGTVERLGLVSDYRQWWLDANGARNVAKAMREKIERSHEPKPVTCEACMAVYPYAQYCPECGAANPKYGRSAHTLQADLRELVGGALEPELEISPDERRLWFGMLREYAHTKGYNPGWAWHKLQEKFGRTNTRGWGEPHFEPSPECLAWIKSRQIAWAKSKRRRAA